MHNQHLAGLSNPSDLSDIKHGIATRTTHALFLNAHFTYLT